MRSLKQKSISAFIWDFGGKVAMNGFAFLTSIILTRLLTPSDFGVIAIATVIIAIAGIFREAGLDIALIQRRKLRPVHYSSVFYFNIAIGTLLTLITLMLSNSISAFYENDKLTQVLNVLSPLFLINALSSVPSTLLRKELKFAKLTTITLASSVTGGVVGIYLAYNGFGIWSLVIQSLLQASIFSTMILPSNIGILASGFSLKAIKQLFHFGFNIFLAFLLESVFSRIDYLIIGKLFPLATLGFFQRAKSLDQLIITYSCGSIMSVLLPVLSKLQNNKAEFQSVVLKGLNAIGFLVFLLLGFLYITSQEIIVFLYTDNWLPAAHYFRILVLSSFAYPINALLVNVMMSSKSSNRFLKLEVLKKFVISLNLLVAFIWGIEGYLYGLILASTGCFILNTLAVGREKGIPPVRIFRIVIFYMSITLASVLLSYAPNQLFIEKPSSLLIGLLFLVTYTLINVLLESPGTLIVKRLAMDQLAHRKP